MERLPVRLARTLLALFVAALLAPAALSAQEGAIAGLVSDVQSRLGLSAVQVEVLDANDAVVAGAFTTGNGAYRITGVPPGSYSVSFTLPGWEIAVETAVSVNPGETTSVNVQLAERSFNLNPITVTTSKRVEKALDAPADVEVVTAQDVRERPATTLADHVKEKAGVDFITTGLQGSYAVIRGFNNIFSGQTLTLTDNRIARVPSLRANIAHLNPTTNSDVDRVEIVLGPGSALYGPNAANGVIHYLTQSPIDYPGVTLAVSSGLRQQDAFSQDVDLITGPATLEQKGTDMGVWQVEGRLATKTNDDKFGIKLSGQYFTGLDYLFIDDEEARQQSIAQVCQSLSYDPTQAACANFSGDLSLPADLEALRTRVDNVAAGRKSDLERWTLDLRTDWRPTPDWNVILSGGRTSAVSSVDLTGIGAANVIDWGYWYGQGRFNYKRLFGQLFYNRSQNDETYLVRSGRPLVDNSSLFVAQLQHSAAINENHSFTYGVDYLRTDPRSEGTINGRHEDDDSVDEFGGYVQYQGELSDQVEVVTALRVDNHSRLKDPVVSPRGAIVFRPNNENSLRLTYNRAFSTPTTLNLFLDISAQSVPITGPFFYDARAQGTTENGFTFNRTNGVPDHMSPFAPLVGETPRDFLPTTTEQLWAEVKGLAVGLSGDPQVGALLDAVQGILGPPPFPVVAATLNPETLSFDNPTTDLASIADVPALDPTIWQTIEVGYKGLLGGKALLAANGYWTHVSDFVSSLRPFTPNVFLGFDQSSLQSYLSTGFAPLVGVLFPDQATADATAAALAAQLGPLGQIPLGVLAPSTAGGQTAAPILFTYQNLGSFSFFGADVSLSYVLNDKWEISGSAAWVEKETFDTGTEIVPLNASKWKGAVTLTWRDEDLGLNAGARGRFVDGFPVASGVYVGDVEGYSVFDFNFGWKIPHTRGLSAQLEIQNVFDNDYQSFVGTPNLGRFSIIRLLWNM